MGSACQRSMPLWQSPAGVATTRVIVKARTIGLTLAHRGLVSKTPNRSLEALATGCRTWKTTAQPRERLRCRDPPVSRPQTLIASHGGRAGSGSTREKQAEGRSRMPA